MQYDNSSAITARTGDVHSVHRSQIDMVAPVKSYEVKNSSQFPEEVRGEHIIVMPGETSMYITITDSEYNVMAVHGMCNHELRNLLELLMDGLMLLESKMMDTIEGDIIPIIPEEKPN